MGNDFGKHSKKALRVENVSPETVQVRVDWGGGIVDSHKMETMSHTDISGQPRIDQILVVVTYTQSKGVLDFKLDAADLHGQAVNIRLAVARGVGYATVNGQKRGRYIPTARTKANPLPASQTATVRHNGAPPRQPSRPKPVLVQIHPRLKDASTSSVLPDLPAPKDAHGVHTTYYFNFDDEIAVLSDAGFHVPALETPLEPDSPDPSSWAASQPQAMGTT
mmetsp:Transcript_18208/g.47484  ORF Transcript_18208/g.47484 Transcript_18208/m.47484 type:complete len:221 (+) Transcript_18208:158-820(+)